MGSFCFTSDTGVISCIAVRLLADIQQAISRSGRIIIALIYATVFYFFFSIESSRIKKGPYFSTTLNYNLFLLLIMIKYINMLQGNN